MYLSNGKKVTHMTQTWNPKNANWGCTPETFDLANRLNDLEIFPRQGSVPGWGGRNKHLEKFRKAQNVVYDIFNNGLGNRGKSLKVLGLKKYDLALAEYVGYRLINPTNWEQIEEVVEEAFTPIVMAAAKEQGLV
jgi:hypothetical protein